MWLRMAAGLKRTQMQLNAPGARASRQDQQKQQGEGQWGAVGDGEAMLALCPDKAIGEPYTVLCGMPGSMRASGPRHGKHSVSRLDIGHTIDRQLHASGKKKGSWLATRSLLGARRKSVSRSCLVPSSLSEWPDFQNA